MDAFFVTGIAMQSVIKDPSVKTGMKQATALQNEVNRIS